MTKKSEARARILELMGRSDGPLRPSEVAEALGRTPGSTRELLRQMALSGEVESNVSGGYGPPRSDGADTPDPADARPDAEPDAPPGSLDAPDEVSGTDSESAIPMRDTRDALAGTFVYSERDGGMIPLSELKKRKGYA